MGERLLREPQLQARDELLNGEISTTLREAKCTTMLSGRIRRSAIDHGSRSNLAASVGVAYALLWLVQTLAADNGRVLT